MKKSILAIASLAILFASCGDSTEPAQQAEPATTTAPETTEPATTTADPGQAAEITLNAGDDMKFDQTEIKVKEGQTVKLKLVHTGKAPVTAMGHNFVLLAQGVSLADFAKEAVAAKDNDYIPQSMAKDVIAHTKTIGGGETTEVEFTAPAKGSYEYLCSFPGHSAMMKGTLVVE